jgi:hypothetical protein
MLRAIGVYAIQEDGQIRLEKSAKRPSSPLFFWSGTDFDAFEKQIFPKIKEKIFEGKICTEQAGNVYFYAARLDNTRLNLIVSDRRLLHPEPMFLLYNTYNVDQRSDILRATVQTILDNPLGYSGRDVLERMVHLELEKTKAKGLNTLEDLLSRGELIEDLDNKAEILKNTTGTFNLEAKRINDSHKCCPL